MLRFLLALVLLTCGCASTHNLRHVEESPPEDVAVEDLEQLIDGRIESYVLRNEFARHPIWGCKRDKEVPAPPTEEHETSKSANR